MLHKSIPLAERHAPHSFEYADAAARTGATGFVAADIGKQALQLDDGTYWRLTATTPTWAAMGGGSGAWADITGKPVTFPPEAHTHNYQAPLTSATQAEMEAGTEAGLRLMSPLLIALAIAALGGGGGGGDPYWNNVTLALHLDGTNGSTTFIDQKGKTATAYGNAQISTVQSKFGGACLALDGAGDYLQFADSTDWDFGTNDFTFEVWVYPTSSGSGNYIFSLGNGANGLEAWISSSTLYFEGSSNGSTWDIANAVNCGAITLNIWNHVAIVRSGTSIKLYLNGVFKNGVTSSAAIYNPSFVRIGARDGSYFNGYIDDFRITNGYARYTTNFTPPTAAFPDA